MATTIVTRAGKGSPLTYDEVDSNFTNLKATADSAAPASSLATVATTGAYADLSGKPTLGTAAATNSTAYATAAQGAKADTALQSSDIGVTVQAKLVSGTNIKTINGTSVLGSGDITISGGGGSSSPIPALQSWTIGAF